ncbi:MAG: ABC transporter ATP-binding protein [Acidobacteria bacterium]|nr:ABC transporter ATP-binding protein [Acidobacteriota bacterium]
MIRLSDISKRFRSPSGEELSVLEGLGFHLRAGASLAVQGPSGSGKSTLLALLAGLERPSGGWVEVAGRRLDALNERELAAFRARNLGFVFQSFHLLPHFSALQNVAIGAEIAGVRNPLGASREALERVGLADRMGHLPGQLSGGECQRVAIARAVVGRPQVLLCDEPTGSLDPANAGKVFDLILELHRDLGNTLVLVTHDAHLSLAMDARLSLERGRLRDLQGEGCVPL